MANIMDSDLVFTIHVMVEGFGALSSITVTTDVGTYTWTPAGWSPSEPMAHEGAGIAIACGVTNTGGAPDLLWANLMATGETHTSATNIAVNGTWSTSFAPFAMYSHNITVGLQAGHIE